MSSLDLSDVGGMLPHTTQSILTLQNPRPRARARGHGHRRRYSHMRSSRSGSIYETIQEELSSFESSPAQSILTQSTSPIESQPVFIVDSDTASIYSNVDETTSLWDDERGIVALRRYYALQDEARSTVTESKRVWTDTPSSIFAVRCKSYLVCVLIRIDPEFFSLQTSASRRRNEGVARAFDANLWSPSF